MFEDSGASNYRRDSTQQRSNQRFDATFNVRIKGADARGVSFDERVRAVNVSEQGLALLTQRDLPHSSSMTISIPGRGISRPRGGRADFLAHAIVAYVLPDGELNRVGLRFVGATLQQNVLVLPAPKNEQARRK